MKNGRGILLLVLVFVFLLSFLQMNARFDPLARYQYADEVNRELVYEYLDQDSIEYMIVHQLQPQRFEKYLAVEEFTIQNLDYYEQASKYTTDLRTVVRFMNQHLSWIQQESAWEERVKVYGFNSLSMFLQEGVDGIKDARLVAQPTKPLLVLHEKDSLFDYKPINLVEVISIPTLDLFGENKGIYVVESLIEPLYNLCLAIEMEFTCNDLVLVRGYLSVEDQRQMYQEAVLMYGIDAVSKHVAMPTQSEFQLGTSIEFYVSKIDKSEFASSPQALWLAENAHKYGFVIRYPKGKEKETKHSAHPLILRYVGKENATYLFDKKLVLEEANNNE